MRIQVQEANRTPSYLNAQRPSTRHIILKLSRVNDKERILKAVRLEKIVHYKGSSIRSSSDFSAQTLQARSAWTRVQNAERQKPPARNSRASNTTLSIRRRNKGFPKQKPREFATTRPAL